MHRERRVPHWRAVLLAAAAAMATSGCTGVEGALFIVQNQVPDEGCIIPSGQTTDFRGRGIIDVAAASGYLFTPLVQSRLVVDTTGESARVVAVAGADVEITVQPGFFSAEEEEELRDDRLTRFSQAFSGSVFPGGATSFAFLVLPVGLLERIDGRLSAGDQILVTADVVIFGEMDGSEVESNPFSYPIDVCSGCLKIDNGDCSGLPDDFDPLVGGECNVLQDAQVDCCTNGGVEVCPVP